MSAEGYIITGLVSIIVSYIGYLGLRDQNRTAKAGSDTTTQSAASDRALKAWEALLVPYREEVKTLRDQLTELRDREQERDRKIATVTAELHRWQTVAKTLARWGTAMRDQLRGLGQVVPAEPDELVALRIVSDVDDDNTL